MAASGGGSSGREEDRLRSLASASRASSSAEARRAWFSASASEEGVEDIASGPEDGILRVVRAFRLRLRFELRPPKLVRQKERILHAPTVRTCAIGVWTDGCAGSVSSARVLLIATVCACTHYAMDDDDIYPLISFRDSNIAALRLAGLAMSLSLAL